MLNLKKINQLESAYEREKIEAELQKEKNQRITLEKENELKTSQTILITTTSFLILVLTLLYLYIRYQKLKRKQQQEFSQKIIDLIDDERVRISRDLHDDIGQSLSLVKSKVNLYQKGKPIDFNDLSNDISYVINQTRSISHGLHPSHLSKIGLKKSIELLLNRVEQATTLITSFKLDNEIDKLDKMTQAQIYRISQEAINNTIKHAKAKSIRIKIIKNSTEEGWRYTYNDNGVGIKNNNNSEKGIGIQTIQERIKKINGKLKILTSSKRGTTLIIYFK